MSLTDEIMRRKNLDETDKVANKNNWSTYTNEKDIYQIIVFVY